MIETPCNPADVLAQARELGVLLSVVDGKLRFSGPAEVVNRLLLELRRNKQGVIEALSRPKAGSNPAPALPEDLVGAARRLCAILDEDPARTLNDLRTAYPPERWPWLKAYFESEIKRLAGAREGAATRADACLLEDYNTSPQKESGGGTEPPQTPVVSEHAADIFGDDAARAGNAGTCKARYAARLTCWFLLDAIDSGQT